MRIVYNSTAVGLNLTSVAFKLGAALSGDDSWGIYSDEEDAILCGFRHDGVLIRVVKALGDCACMDGVLWVKDCGDKVSKYDIVLPDAPDCEEVILDGPRVVSVALTHPVVDKADDLVPCSHWVKRVVNADPNRSDSDFFLSDAAVRAGREISGDDRWFCSQNVFGLRSLNCARANFLGTDETFVKVVELFGEIRNECGRLIIEKNYEEGCFDG